MTPSDKMLQLMSPADRKALGKAGRTMQEISAQHEVKSEKELQNQIRDLLRRFNIEWYCWSRMDKKTHQKVGWPDFVIPLPRGKTLYWEVKHDHGMPSKEQKACLEWLYKEGHRVSLIRSYMQAYKELTEALK